MSISKVASMGPDKEASTVYRFLTQFRLLIYANCSRAFQETVEIPKD